MKMFLKSVKILQNYDDESVAPFFGPPCILTVKSRKDLRPELGAGVRLTRCVSWEALFDTNLGLDTWPLLTVSLTFCFYHFSDAFLCQSNPGNPIVACTPTSA